MKHLLGGLPPVVERVKLMRKGQAPNGSMEDNYAKMAQSQVCTTLGGLWHASVFRVHWMVCNQGLDSVVVLKDGTESLS